MKVLPVWYCICQFAHSVNCQVMPIPVELALCFLTCAELSSHKHINCNPKHIYLQVSHIEINPTCIWVNKARIWLFNKCHPQKITIPTVLIRNLS